MSGNDEEKPKIAVLTDEEPRHEPDLDPPEDKHAGASIKRGMRSVTLIGGLFVLVFLCGLIPTLIYMWTSGPERGGSLAVLPFVLSAQDDSFADKVTADLIGELSKQELLQVKSKDESMKLKGDERSVDEIGKALGVKYVIQGEVDLKEDTTFTLKVNLVNIEAGGQVYAKRYTGSVGEVGAAEADVVKDVLEGTMVVLPEQEG